MSQPSADEPSALSTLWGGLLVAAGALIAATCGSCTALVFLAGLPELMKGAAKGDLSMLAALPVLLIGVIPTVVGVLMFRAGAKRFRRPGPVQPPPSKIVE